MATVDYTRLFQLAPYSIEAPRVDLFSPLSSIANAFTERREAERDQANKDRMLELKKAEIAREQSNADRSFALERERFGFERSPEGGMRPVPGGPQDPDYLGRRASATNTSDIMSDINQRTAAVRAQGLDPNAPGMRAYVLTGKMPGEQNKPPAGYRWNDPNDPNAGVTPIPGGPGEKVDAEVAARIGLARSFLGQYPEIERRIKAGEMTGWNAPAGYIGMGMAGETRRMLDSGAEALLRNLTGAGMNKEEAAQYVRRYQFSPTDTAETATSKLAQLKREIESVVETVSRGRGGSLPPFRPVGPQGARPEVKPSARVWGDREAEAAGLYERPAGRNESASAPARVNSPEEAMRLPSGTVFVTPDGRVKVRP